eukprot:2456585-Pleurochrysis_carterae.AAC.1
MQISEVVPMQGCFPKINALSVPAICRSLPRRRQNSQLTPDNADAFPLSRVQIQHRMMLREYIIGRTFGVIIVHRGTTRAQRQSMLCVCRAVLCSSLMNGVVCV